MCGEVDDMVDETEVSIDEVVPCARFVGEASLKELAIQRDEGHGRDSSGRRVAITPLRQQIRCDGNNDSFVIVSYPTHGIKRKFNLVKISRRTLRRVEKVSDCNGRFGRMDT